MHDLSSILWEALAVFLYFMILVVVAVKSYTPHLSETDFILGNRSMNFWLTALTAHASDMSSWLFMGYPAMIYVIGVHQAWAGIGLLIFMFLNWQLIAPKVRTATEQYDSMTFSSFFENRLGDISGVIRIFTAIMLFVFYTIYISAALVGMGYVLNILFGIEYHLSVIIGILIVVPYVFFGGYLTLAWIDLFQGLFLLCVIVFVPLYILPAVGGFSGVLESLKQHNLSTSLIPSFSPKSLFEIFFLTIGWGLGYFGQPHIITKFMGIRKVSEIKKAKRIGMTWMVFALGSATLIGLIGVPFFKGTLKIESEVFIQMVNQTFPAFIAGFFLCAIFAATINAMSAMVLVLSSSLTEDIYKKVFRKKADSKELLLVSRLSVIFVSMIAFMIAVANVDTIYGLVLYAWSGLGASFGPLLLLCLWMRKINKYGAWCGILSGGIIAAFWPLVAHRFPIEIPPLPPAFTVSFLSIWIVSKLTAKKSAITEI
ncbi:MAG: High-affinity proline transporter PutP [Chlamydiae bacterium]|nr:High-affinity proline transporter PutP [Chlamydiota bacterium]